MIRVHTWNRVVHGRQSRQGLWGPSHLDYHPKETDSLEGKQIHRDYSRKMTKMTHRCCMLWCYFLCSCKAEFLHGVRYNIYILWHKIWARLKGAHLRNSSFSTFFILRSSPWHGGKENAIFMSSFEQCSFHLIMHFVYLHHSISDLRAELIIFGHFKKLF